MADRTTEVLTGALEFIEIGWGQGKLCDKDGNVCAMGAVRRTRDILGLARDRNHTDRSLFYLNHAVDQLSDFRGIVEYNDNLSKEDVKLVFKHAIEASQQ